MVTRPAKRGLGTTRAQPNPRSVRPWSLQQRSDASAAGRQSGSIQARSRNRQVCRVAALEPFKHLFSLDFPSKITSIHQKIIPFDEDHKKTLPRDHRQSRLGRVGHLWPSPTSPMPTAFRSSSMPPSPPRLPVAQHRTRGAILSSTRSPSGWADTAPPSAASSPTRPPSTGHRRKTPPLLLRPTPRTTACAGPSTSPNRSTPIAFALRVRTVPAAQPGRRHLARQFLAVHPLASKPCLCALERHVENS